MSNKKTRIKLDPRVERFLVLIDQARREKQRLVSDGNKHERTP